MRYYKALKKSDFVKWVLNAVLLLSSILFPLKAQQNHIEFKTLSSKDGLSSSIVWSLAQDNHGFIWVGTYDGLNRYNGYDFKTYRHQPQDTNSLSGNFISSIFFDSKNRLWVNSPAGLNLYDPEMDHFNRFSTSGKPETLPPNILWIYEDKEQNIWTGTSDGMNRFNEKERKFEKSEMLRKMGISKSVTALLQDNTGRFWLGTDDGLYRYSPGQRTYRRFRNSEQDPRSLINNQIYSLFEDSHGRVWIGTSGGLSLYEPETDTFKNLESHSVIPDARLISEVRSIEQAADGNLWLGTYDGGIKKFTVATQSFETYQRDPKEPTSLADNSVKKILVDKMGGLWVATFRGVSYTNEFRMKFDHFEYKSYDSTSLTDNFITALFRDSHDTIWVGNRFGISKYQPEKENFVHYTHQPDNAHSISNGAIISISEDLEGNLWTTTHTGIVDKFDRSTKRFYRFEHDPKNSNSIEERSNYVLCGRDGNIWVSSPQGISRYNKQTAEFTHYRIPEAILKGQIGFMYEDSRENLWVISWGAIYLFDKKSGNFSLFKAIPEKFLPFQTTQIHEDQHQNLWIGSVYKGLISYNLSDSSLTVYENEKDLSNLFIKGILDDGQGNLWISSNTGLCRFNPQTKEYKLYGLEEGLKNSEFNQRVCVMAGDGKFWFGGNYGITVFCPDQSVQNPHPPKVAITNFQLFNKNVPIGEDSPLKKSITNTSHIDLNYTHSVLSFEFVGLNYNAPEKNQYAYRMLGFENDWNYSGTRRHASYTNLPPGKTYIFQVKASNNDGIWNEEGTAISLYIKPPFWTTWWFYSLSLVLCLLALYGIYRWRTRQLYLQRKELERKVHERTEEVEAQKEKLAAHASHLKNANKEIKYKNKKIMGQAQELKALDKLKSRFLANISHEFRTPLTLIMLPLEEMLQASKTADDGKSQLSVMKRNALRLLQLINQLLDLSKLENEHVTLDLVRKDVIPFLNSVIQSFESLAHKQKVEFNFTSTTSTIITSFDADKLEKIMYNLLSNAFKFTPEGGSILVSAQTVELTPGEPIAEHQTAQRQYLQITVSDTGQGIPPKHLPYIFDRFYQGEPSPTRKSDGTGIGLALTKELIELQGGSIKVTSEASQGTCFKVLLPLALKEENIEEDPQTPNPKESAEELEAEALFQNMRKTGLIATEEAPLLLLVEDNTDLRQQIKRIFVSNYRIEEAADGIEGWSKASELSPDLIISDVMMPGKDGFVLCRQLKDDVSTSHIPTILLSARIDGEETGLQLGADDYITKPFNARVLALKVNNLLVTRLKFREAICRELGLKSISKGSEPEGIKANDQQFIETASKIAIEHLTNPKFDTELLYRELGMSRTLVYNKLKSLTGLSPNEFVRKIRLNKASLLITEGGLSITEVMYAVGFNHRSYFIKCFKNEFGHLPSEHLEFETQITSTPG